jgi:hypothetical protein
MTALAPTAPAQEHSSATRHGLRAVLALDALAVGSWLIACAWAHGAVPSGPLGLLEELPLLWWFAIVALATALTIALRRPVPAMLLLAQPVLLAVVLLATPALVEPFARVPTGYVHVGLVEHVVRTGGLLDQFDARYEWPGSIGLGALVTLLGGVDSAIVFLRWSPLVFVLAMLIPLHAILDRLMGDRRTVALGLWLFVAVNWVGQDYWSPQALNFLLVLVVVAVVLHHVPERSGASLRDGVAALWRWQEPVPSVDGAARRQRLAAIGSVALIGSAVAVSHQLTPFVLLLFLAVLVVVGRRDLGLLPLALALVVIGWVSWGAVEYWSGHAAFLSGDVGRVGAVVDRGVAVRLQGGSGARDAVLYGRIGFSVLVWAGAAWAAWRGRRRRPVQVLAALAASPFVLIGIQSYGGEMPLRVFLFSSPFAAALLAVPAQQLLTGRPRTALVGTGALAALVLGLVLCRWGNEAFEGVYPEDIAAARFVYGAIPEGERAIVAEVSPFSPLRTERIDTIRYVSLVGLARPDLYDPVEVVSSTGASELLLVLTRGQLEYGVLALGSQPGWDDRVIRALTDAGVGEVVFQRGEATVMRIRPRTGAGS